MLKSVLPKAKISLASLTDISNRKSNDFECHYKRKKSKNRRKRKKNNEKGLRRGREGRSFYEVETGKQQ